MEYRYALSVENSNVEFVDFLGYQIPKEFTVLFWIADQDYEDLFTVKLKYEIQEEGTPQVLEVLVSGPHPENFPSYVKGRVFRKQLAWVDKNFQNLKIGGLQVAVSYQYRLEQWENGHLAIGKYQVKIDLTKLQEFELEMREKLRKSRKITPEFKKELLQKRATYKSLHGSHRGFNQQLAEIEGVEVGTVESWVTKAQSQTIKKTKTGGKRERTKNEKRNR